MSLAFHYCSDSLLPSGLLNEATWLSSRTERSTDQVMNPVNTEALVKWVGKIPADVLKDMADIAPMLSRLGYDPQANPPDYTKLQEPSHGNSTLLVRDSVASHLERVLKNLMQGEHTGYSTHGVKQDVITITVML